MGPEGGHTPRRTGRLTVGRRIRLEFRTTLLNSRTAPCRVLFLPSLQGLLWSGYSPLIRPTWRQLFPYRAGKRSAAISYTSLILPVYHTLLKGTGAPSNDHYALAYKHVYTLHTSDWELRVCSPALLSILPFYLQDWFK
jgi:hypothetical protein